MRADRSVGATACVYTSGAPGSAKRVSAETSAALDQGPELRVGSLAKTAHARGSSGQEAADTERPESQDEPRTARPDRAFETCFASIAARPAPGPGSTASFDVFRMSMAIRSTRKRLTVKELT
jgi:hypothetical protein